MIAAQRLQNRVIIRRATPPRTENVRGAPPTLRFGPFELNLATEELRKFGTLIKVAPQPFQLLALLASQAGQLVTREQIQFQLWGNDTFVDFEQGMNHCIRQIRSALSDNAETPRYIETVPRRGYRFVAHVEVVQLKVAESLLKFPEETTKSRAVAATLEASGRAGVAAVPVMEAVADTPTESSGSKLLRRWIALGLLILMAGVSGLVVYRILRTHDSLGRSAAPDARHRRTIAILGFRKLADHPDTGIPVSTALTTMLATEFAADDQLRVVPSAEVERLKLEMHLQDADSLPGDVLKRIARSLGADYVVTGSYIEEGNQVRVDLRVQDTVQGDVLLSLGENGDIDVTGLAEIVSKAGASIRPKLGLPAVSAGDVSGIRATLPADPAAEYYYQGLAKLRTFDALAARNMLEKAVVIQPDFAPAHLALAEALNTLGYSKLAREEAEKAYRFSAELPQPQRLLVEARYRELTSKWDQAVALYQKLFESGRDNVDYGLYLAAAQREAGKGQDSLATLQRLRALPPPERDDLRIDLEEANAFYALGDYEQEQSAADRAARKAEALGGGFALTKARMAQVKALFYRGHLDEALAMYRESLSLSEAFGDKGEIAASTNNIASTLQEQGKLATALELYDKALTLNREIGNRKWEAGTLSNMGTVYQLEGELSEAMKMYRQSLDIYRELGERMHEGIVVNNIAEVLFLSGNLDAARRNYEDAIAIDRQIQNRSNEAEALFGLGQVLAAEADLAASRSAHEKALAIRTQLKQEDTEQESRLALATIALEQYNPAAAEATARNAAQAFQSMNLREKQVEALTLEARALLAQGKKQQAAQAIAEANAAAAEIQNRILLLDLDLVSAEVMSQSDDARSRLQGNQKLASIVSEATQRGYMQLELKATLALGESEIRSGSAGAGLSRLATLRKQASARGFRLVARQAAAAEKISKPATA
jgi:DNA-binding winged helix-turn-helix (wHTH) protein/tetratricopeptide (TPR) repeat protein/TolB-like protein